MMFGTKSGAFLKNVPYQINGEPGLLTFHEGKMQSRPSAKGNYTGLTVTVRATMPNADELLWPGTLVRTRITGRSRGAPWFRALHRFQRLR